jgi:hypothetical protein
VPSLLLLLLLLLAVLLRRGLIWRHHRKWSVTAVD